MTEYFAHSPRDGIPAQPYAAHVEGVRLRARRYAQEAGKYARYDGTLLLQTAEKAAAFHDLGKLCRENQNVLAGGVSAKSLPVNHVDAGAAHFLSGVNASVVSAAVVQAHHIGFPSFPAEANKGENAFRDVQLAARTDRELTGLEKLHNALIASRFSQADAPPEGDLPVFLRMLLSCIADADHTDTAVHYKHCPPEEKRIELRPADRLARLDLAVASLQEKGEKNRRNALRGELYQSCRAAEIDGNIGCCGSPVGFGKTTAVMAHLLAQAQSRGLRRIFVVLPFTNIIRQAVRVYREMLVLPGENPEEVVAELHHRADFESEDVRHLTALWRAPIVVTTAVAFFETLASNSPAALRRLHELPGSAVFVDESHAALPAGLLPLAWKWINLYARQWGCYWVLASGTLNRFWEIPEIAAASGCTQVPEIVSGDVRRKLFAYEHVRMAYKWDLRPKTTAELVGWITKFTGPRLVILNTVQSAAAVAKALAEKCGRSRVEHLSTALTPGDRERTLDRVEQRLADRTDTDWTLVATSCVEAGMNFSFQIGFRELGSFTSLLQTAGRVGRNGEPGDFTTWTFRLAEDGVLKQNPGLQSAATVLRTYLKSGMEIVPEQSTRAIADEIRLAGCTEKYGKLLQYEEVRDFPRVEKDFRVIDSDTCLAVADASVAGRLESGKIDWRELQRVSVQIPKYKLDRLGTPVIRGGIYRWDRGYDDFLGYMAGILNHTEL